MTEMEDDMEIAAAANNPHRGSDSESERKSTPNKRLCVNQFQSMNWFFLILVIMTYVFTHNLNIFLCRHSIMNIFYAFTLAIQRPLHNVKQQLSVGCCIWDGSSDIISILTTFQLFSFANLKKIHHINDIIATQTDWNAVLKNVRPIETINFLFLRNFFGPFFLLYVWSAVDHCLLMSIQLMITPNVVLNGTHENCSHSH